MKAFVQVGVFVKEKNVSNSNNRGIYKEAPRTLFVYQILRWACVSLLQGSYRSGRATMQRVRKTPQRCLVTCFQEAASNIKQHSVGVGVLDSYYEVKRVSNR